MTEYSYYDYIYKSGELIFMSYRMKREGFVLYFNFTQGKGDIKTFGSNHPIREKMREAHR